MPQKKTQPAGAAAKPVAAKTDKPVKDLVKPMTFLIGAVDHDGACPRDEDHCPISNRLMRMPGVLDASTGSKIVFFERRDAWWRGEMDSRTYAAVLGYDGDQALIPVGFPVTLLPPKSRGVLGWARSREPISDPAKEGPHGRGRALGTSM